MNHFKHLNLRDCCQGDFSVRNQILFYREKPISSTGKLILSSDEEAFFHFVVTDEETSKKFRHVFLLNDRYPYFYTATEIRIESKRFQFISPLNGENAFRLISFDGSDYNTKIIGDNYHY